MNRILLVEDDADVRLLLEHVLRRADYQVDTAPTAAAASARLASRRYELVIADRLLDDGDGVRIADAAAERGIKTLVITGKMFVVPKAEAERHEFLMKPLRPDELLRAVERRLGTAA